MAVEQVTADGPGANTARKQFGLLCLTVLVLASVAVGNLTRSATGWRFLAVRSNERASAAIGIDVARTKLLGFAFPPSSPESAAACPAGPVPRPRATWGLPRPHRRAEHAPPPVPPRAGGPRPRGPTRPPDPAPRPAGGRSACRAAGRAPAPRRRRACARCGRRRLRRAAGRA
ncbi:hypothetical protein J4573_02430 [Actinomadura barringtoniae]|uniref:Uncharacterized protein n=1 Tax=Actinomadura barringtoniae TaxID=1427535 RepID=A0A939PCG6_9ACTN|nr:hypothetical protein [Actinomadura barringtoniae]